MAWPLSRYESAVAGNTVKAALLNAIQDAIGAAFGATQSLKALVIDGTGGQSVSPTAGTLTTSGAATIGAGLTVSAGNIGATLGSITSSTGNVVATLGSISGRRLVGTQSIGTATAGSASGTGATVAVSGSDIGGTVELTTGTGASTGKMVTVSFGVAFPSTPVCVVVFPGNSETAGVLAQSGFWTEWTANNFAIQVGGPGLNSNATYKFSYAVVG
jgi:hypothetical protein